MEIEGQSFKGSASQTQSGVDRKGCSPFGWFFRRRYSGNVVNTQENRLNLRHHGVLSPGTDWGRPVDSRRVGPK